MPDLKRIELKSMTLQSPLEAWILGLDHDKKVLDKLSALLLPEIYRAVNIIASAVATYPYGIYRGEDEVTDANEPDGWSDLLYMQAADYTIFGACYALKEKNRFGVFKPRRLLPSTIEPVFDRATGKPIEFKRTINGMTSVLPSDSVVYQFAPNYFGEAGAGQAPIDAALAIAGLAKSQADMLKGYYERGAPLTLFSYSGIIDEAEGNALVRWWNDIIKRGQQAYKAVLMRGDVKPQVFGSNARDAFTQEVMSWTRESICVALGIPVSVMQSNAANYATAQSDRSVLQDNTIRPLITRLFAAWNDQHFAKLNLEIWAEHDATNASSQAFLNRAKAISEIVGQPVLTIDEGRALLGLDPVPPQALEKMQPKKEAEPQDEEGEDEEERTPEQMKAWRKQVLAQWREGRSDYGTPFDAQLAACRTKTDVRAVFERNWPRPVEQPAPAEDHALMALLSELEAARKAVEREGYTINIHNAPPAVAVNLPQQEPPK